MANPTLPELVDRGLAASTADGCVIIVDHETTTNLRWANNTLTTNGSGRGTVVTVISTVDSSAGTAAASLTRTVTGLEALDALVSDADAAAREASPAPDANPLVTGDADPGWDELPEVTGIGVFEAFSAALGDAMGRARGSGRVLYGFVEHTCTSTYLGTSTGLRRRHVQPGGHVSITAKDESLTRSAWVGQSTRDFGDVDALALDAELDRRLGWAERSVSLEPGRYDTVLPPAAVADLMIYAYWTAGAREAHEGQTVFGRPGGGTRIGEQLSPKPVTLSSDPASPGLETAPFVIARSSGAEQSVFDNGLPLGATDWIERGTLTNLLQTRHSAQLTGHDVTPVVDNLKVFVDDATGSTEDLLAGIERGLLLTCLWYIREVDPQTLLLTGLTRDGVYLVEHGEITGAVNNFRFNESPIDLLGRFSHAGTSVPSFSREWGDYFLRTATPALRVPDFNMSSVSQAH